MSVSERAAVIEINNLKPNIAPEAWVAPGAVVVGSVSLGPWVSVWYNAVVRGDTEEIHIGENSNIQDSCTLHADPGFPIKIGAAVTVGHGAIIHGADIGEGSLVGMGARILNGAQVGKQCLVAAGALLPEGFEAGPRSLIIGSPARVLRPLDDSELQLLRESSDEYLDSAALHERRAKIQ